MHAYPAFDRYLIRLRFEKRAEFRFHPGFALHALLCAALRGHPPKEIFPFAHEVGVTAFDEGEPYHWELVFVGEARERSEAVRQALQALGAGVVEKGFAAGLAGRYRLEAFERLAPPDPGAQVARLQRVDSIEVEFLAPLRLQREAPVSKRRRFVDETHFEARYFLEKLGKRLGFLAEARDQRWLRSSHPTEPLRRGTSIQSRRSTGTL